MTEMHATVEDFGAAGSGATEAPVAADGDEADESGASNEGDGEAEPSFDAWNEPTTMRTWPATEPKFRAWPTAAPSFRPWPQAPADEADDEGEDEPSAPEPAPDAPSSSCDSGFSLWSAMCREDLPSSMSSFAEPEQPDFYGSSITARSAADLANIPDGSRVTIAADMTSVALNRTDVEVVIAEGVSVGSLSINDCTRCLVRGEGREARVRNVFMSDSTDVTLDGLMIRADSGLAVDLHTSTRVAITSSVFSSGSSAAAYAGNMSHLMFANCSWSSSDANGVNDWGIRLANTSDVVIVDSQVEARGLQPVLRRSGAASRHFYLRTTTINLYAGESTTDVGGTIVDTYDEMYQVSPTYYMSNLNGRATYVRFGGIPDDSGSRGVYEVTDAHWFTPPSGDVTFLDDAGVAAREGATWRYRLGNPTYDNSLSGSYDQRHPGWPERRSERSGAALSVSNPYSL